MARYAEGTTVTPNRSMEEILRTLDRYGADQRSIGDDDAQITVAFRLRGSAIRLSIPVPARRTFRSPEAHQREIRRLWRVLLLLLKSKLELITEQIESVDQAFLAYLVLPDGNTFGDVALAQIEQARESGTMPTSVLPGAKIIALGSGGNR